MRDLLIKEIICRDRGDEDYVNYSSFELGSNVPVVEAVEGVLNSIPSSFGACVMMSAGLVAVLKAHYSIPAVAFLGDLVMDDVAVFKCQGSLPEPTYEGQILQGLWNGHCWVEVAGTICDVSIFRSAYAIHKPSLLRLFIHQHFGVGKGALLARPNELPPGMEYVPKYALNDHQISCVLSGLSMQAKAPKKI